MNDLQIVMLDSLKEFIRVCEKHKLKYYLIGGTALGAIRHGGFIPWDDDLDVGMPRPDFEKLLKLKDEFKKPYFLQHYTTDPSYTYGFMKLRNSNTTYIETTLVQHNINHGVWIDIFPIDGMSKKNNATKVKGIKPHLLWFAFYFTFLGHFWKKPRLKTLWRDIPGYIVSIIFIPLNIGNWLTRLIHRCMKKISYSEATLVGSYHTWSFNKEALPKDFYGDGKKVKFEDIEAIIPSNYDAYLTAKYGNYLQLPPENKREGHHKNYGFSLTVGYKDYIFKDKR
jgi:lipopolysaccharide cholinephosphotransferase